jgi:hypothetical protein
MLMENAEERGDLRKRKLEADHAGGGGSDVNKTLTCCMCRKLKSGCRNHCLELQNQQHQHQHQHQQQHQQQAYPLPNVL